jgi:hypothetical protein
LSASPESYIARDPVKARRSCYEVERPARQSRVLERCDDDLKILAVVVASKTIR